jgi:hypothetical protein
MLAIIVSRSDFCGNTHPESQSKLLKLIFDKSKQNPGFRPIFIRFTALLKVQVLP